MALSRPTNTCTVERPSAQLCSTVRALIRVWASSLYHTSSLRRESLDGGLGRRRLLGSRESSTACIVWWSHCVFMCKPWARRQRRWVLWRFCWRVLLYAARAFSKKFFL